MFHSRAPFCVIKVVNIAYIHAVDPAFHITWVGKHYKPNAVGFIRSKVVLLSFLIIIIKTCLDWQCAVAYKCLIHSYL